LQHKKLNQIQRLKSKQHKENKLLQDYRKDQKPDKNDIIDPSKELIVNNMEIAAEQGKNVT